MSAECPATSDESATVKPSPSVCGLNRVLRRWGNYFRYGNSGRKFSQIDGHVNERLALLASAKHGPTGRNSVAHFNSQWANQLGIYRLDGTVKAQPSCEQKDVCRACRLGGRHQCGPVNGQMIEGPGTLL